MVWEGAAVLAGRVAEDALVPYQAWVEALDGYLAAVPPRWRRRWSARDEQVLARILPGVGAEPAPSEDRFRLLEAVTSLLAAICHGRPTVLILDDLHWAERASLILLGHVLRWHGPMRLLVVVTYRESELGRAHPLSAALADLRRDVPSTASGSPGSTSRGRGARSGGARALAAPSTGAPAATRSSRASCSATPPSRAATACRKVSAR